MQILPSILTTGMLALFPMFSSAAEAEWLADFDVALAQAQTEKKDLLVNFSGSDWNGLCIKLDQEIFSTQEFASFAEDKFVLVTLDFPESEELIAAIPNVKRNQEVANEYRVSAYPTVLLMSNTGEVFGKLDYVAGGPKPFTAAIEVCRVKGKAELASTLKLVAEWEAAQTAATADTRKEVWKRAFAHFETLSEDSVARNPLVPMLRTGIELDPKNEAGIKAQATKVILLVDGGNTEQLASARALDPLNQFGVLELVVQIEARTTENENLGKLVSKIKRLDELGILNEAVAADLYATGAYLSWRYLENRDDAVMFAIKVVKLEPDDKATMDMIWELLEDLGELKI